MRRLRSIKVRGISEVIGKGFAYVMFGVTWIIGYAISKIVDRANRRNVYDDDYDVKFGYKKVADKIYDISYTISEFILRCSLWFIINIIGGIIIGMILGCVSMIALIFGALFVGLKQNKVVEEYYYYY